MLHVDHLLCLASGTSPTSAVLRQGVHLAESLGATLHVMPLGGGAVSDDVREKWKDYTGDSGPDGMEVVPSPGTADRSIEAIGRYVEEQNVDLVIVDTPADRGPVPPLADSFVETLMRELDRPVYAVEQVADPKTIRRILVPTDLSDHSLVALKHAAGLASIYGASIALLHVIDTSPYVALTTIDRLSLRGTTLPEHRARRRLQNFVKTGRLTDVSVHSHLKFGDPADQIGAFIGREGIDLVVLSSHGTMTSARRPFGRVTDRVLRRVRSPFFLVKAFGRSLLSQEDCPDAMSTAKTGA